MADPDAAEQDSREAFLRLIDRLARTAAKVRVASHDAELVQRSLDLLQGAGVACELELLYGLPVQAPLTIAAQRRLPVRMYVPYGMGSLPYAVDYLRSNPRKLWWLLKDAARGSYKERFPALDGV